MSDPQPSLSERLGALTPRRLITVSALTAAWCALWGNISIANLLGGAVISFAASTPMFGTPHRGAIRFGALVQLIGLVAIDLAKSTIAVASETLTPTDYTDESIIAVELPDGSQHHLMFLVIAITLTPGTAVVDIERGGRRLYLHLLHHDGAADTIEHVQHLARVVARALPSDEASTTDTDRSEASS